ncbi:MAG: SpaA isopeptide-forming pilin-related protein, partial [Lawsonibacter sp.]
DPATAKVHWTVTVDTRKQDIPDLAVYDLLVYGSSTSGFSLADATGFPTGLTTGGLTPRYDQKYVDDSFAGSGLILEIIPISQGGHRVADLLKITGLSTTAPNTFSFDSLVVNPDVFAGNKTSTVWNTATLFSANARLNAASKDVGYDNQILAKELLKREAIDDPAAGVNIDRTTDAAAGFDYKSKSVVFRLVVNADGIPFDTRIDAAGNPMGTAIVTDTLPEGWEYVDIASGSKYLIFEGSKGTDGIVTAGAQLTPADVPGFTASPPTFVDRTATFTFNTLDKPYVILVKARPTDETVAGYFDSNGTVTPRNNLTLRTASWTPGATAYQDVSITSRLLGKSLDHSVRGVLRWTVEYRPYDLTQPGTRLEDKLPKGIDLRTDASGTLLLAGNITAHKMTLNSNGSYTVGDEVTLVLGQDVSNNRETRILTFNIPDSKQAYQFSYVTDVTGETGRIENHVALYGGDTSQEDTAAPYTVENADVSATLKRSGWSLISKTDGAGDPLPGAEFTLFALDNQTVIRTGVTGPDGTLRFKVIPDGDYKLRETGVPAGYTSDGKTYSLSVRTTLGGVVASIDEKTGADANTVTVQNFSELTEGSLTVRKLVAGNAADSAKAFDLTVSFPTATGTYSYVGSGVPD